MFYYFIVRYSDKEKERESKKEEKNKKVNKNSYIINIFNY